MIPIILKIKGLYSYVEEQTIDFKRLTDAGLFGIFGEVGSGKSTILEAMALALYTKSERLNISGDDRYYNMLNLKTNEAVIEFQFLAGAQKDIFKSILRFSRNKKNFEEVKFRSHEFYQLINGVDPIPIEQEKVLEVVGISYENFKRTIIIPQGQFKEFLDLSSTERTRMLKELFDLQRFELSPKLAAIETENKAALQRTEGELNSYEGVSSDSIEIIEKEWQKSKEESERLQIEKNKLEAIVLNLQELKKNTEQLNNKKTVLQQKEVQESNDLQKEEELQEFENLMNSFQQPYRDLRKYKDAIDAAEIQLKEGAERNSFIENELVEVNIQLLDLTNKARQAENFRNKLQELDKVIAINNATEKLNEIEKNISITENKINVLKSRVQSKKTERTDLEEKKIELSKIVISESILYETKNWFRELSQQEKEIKLLIQESEKINPQIQAIDIQLNSYNLESFNNYAEFESIYLKRNQMIEAEKDIAIEALNTINVQKELQHHAALLVDGQPCTLCGSAHHPSPILIKDFTSDIEQLSQQIDQYKKQLDELNALRTSVTGLLENKVRLNENYKLVNNNLVNANSIHLITSSSQPDKKFGVNDIDLFSENEKISKENRIHLDEIEKLIQEAYTFIELESENVNKIEIEYKKLQLNQGALKITIINNSEGLKEVTPKAYANISVKAIEIEKKRLLADIESNEATLIDTQKIADGLEKEQTLLIGKMSGINESIKNIEKLQEQTREQIKLLVDKGHLNETEIKAILKKQLDVIALRKIITENRKLFHLLQGEIAVLEKLVAEVSFNDSVFNEKTEAFNNTKELLTKATEKKGNLEGQLKNQKEALEKKTLLQSQQEALIIRATDISTLKKLFNASGFVEFVSKRYLQNVVALANNRFGKMVRQKFGMELSEKGDFIVRDYLNGGKTRLLKSLSGGQTFQAALCLALALSESMQRNAGIDQHFFFLDEGFGSLDKENLQIVLSTLQSLRQENRVVGLISHVEELQQEMDVFLKVENDPVRGTIIKESWRN